MDAHLMTGREIHEKRDGQLRYRLRCQRYGIKKIIVNLMFIIRMQPHEASRAAPSRKR